MFSGGLSLEQAPPIGVILRFFLTVPFFGALFCLVLMFGGAQAMMPHAPTAVAAAHLFFVGVVATAMVGALFQMLPVLAGVVIAVPSRHAAAVHALLFSGALALAGAFVTFQAWVYVLAGVLLGGAVLYLAVLMFPPLLLRTGASETLRGMQVALGSFALAAVFALAMLYGFATGETGKFHEALRGIHFGFALFGWVGMLIVAVAYQVIEMFYVTPPYPATYKKAAWAILAAAMLLKGVWLFAGWRHGTVFDAVIAALMLGFAVITLWLLSKRKRPVADTAVWFWRLGMGMLILSVGFWALFTLSEEDGLLPAALIAYGAFALAIVSGMMYKIVPFLVWFHLSNQGYVSAPVMAEVISARRARQHLYLFSVAVVMMLAGFFWSEVLLRASGGMLIGAFFLLGYNLVTAVRIYRKIRKEELPITLSALQ